MLPAILTEGASEANVMVFDVKARVIPDLCSTKVDIKPSFNDVNPFKYLPVNASPVSLTIETVFVPGIELTTRTKLKAVPPANQLFN